MNPLTQLANRFESDKGSRAGKWPHLYTYLYDLIFYEFRDKNFNFLELGLAIGGPEVGGSIDRKVGSPSVAMWLEFFPKAHIIGFDISDFSHIHHDRFSFYRGDGGSEGDLVQLAEAVQECQIIIDDASHASLHQQLAFKHLFPCLKSGGLYIIEDTHWQPEVFEKLDPNLPKSHTFFMEYFLNGNYMTNKVITQELALSFIDQIYSISFFPAFNGYASGTKQIVFRKK